MRSRPNALNMASLAAAVVMLVAFAAGVAPAAVPIYPRLARQSTLGVLSEFKGVKIYDGGYGSSMATDPTSSDHLYLLTDRGPNTDTQVADQKAFYVPTYTPRIGRFRITGGNSGGNLELVSIIELSTSSGRKLTGLPNPPGDGWTGEAAVDQNGRRLDYDPEGIDSEGLVAMPDGTFWISDEYGPWLLHVDHNGRSLERVGPFGSGPKRLPAVLAKRRANRGMEGLSVVPGRQVLVGMMQSPLDNPSPAVRRTSRVLRIVLLDLVSGATRQFVYVTEQACLMASEVAAVSDTSLLVLERDGSFPGDRDEPAQYKRVYLVDLAGATDVSDPGNGPAGRLVNGRPLETLSDAELRSAGITPVTKTLLVDLLALPVRYPHDKVEGLAIVNDRLIAVSNDDDFGILDDGQGGLRAKRVPAGPMLIDRGTVYFIPLDRSLKR